MGVIVPNFASSTEDRSSGALVIDGGLRFDGGKSHHLTKTPDSAGNRKTWTHSFWFKLSNITGYQYFFSANNPSGGGSSFDILQMDNSASTIVFYGYNGSSYDWLLSPTAVFRDPSAWQHFVIAFDTTQATASNRVKWWHNGNLLTLDRSGYTTYPSLNVDSRINNTVSQRLSDQTYGLTSHLTNIHFIDGQALDPSYFGYTDPLTNTWRPKKYTGSFNTTFTTDNATGALPIMATSDNLAQTLSSGTRSDSNASSLQLCVPMNGSNNGTTFTDQSPTGRTTSTKTITRSGTPVTSTTDYKFYGSSGYFGGSDYLSVSTSESLGSGAWTAEFWYKHTRSESANSSGVALASNGTDLIISINDWGSQSFVEPLYTGTSVSGGFTTRYSGTTSLVKNVWNHIAVCRSSGGVYNVYINGSLSTYSSRTNETTSYTSFQSIGARPGRGANITGYMQDVRVYAGLEKYTSGFTPMMTFANGFYLPFDGNSPIGQDRSGNNNNWTPVNFGGSNTIEKATGALPILNTDGGGKVARVGVRTDSNASSLVLALPLVGIKSDFSNAINSGTSNKAITNNGATVSTTQGNFYGGSFAFGDSNSQYLTASSSDFSFGTGAFTIECWYKFNVDGSGFEDVFVSQTDSNTGISLYMAGNDLYVRWGANPNWNRFSFTPATDRWYHIALVREGTGTGQTKVYIDGVSQTPVEGAFSIPTNFSETSINIGRFTNIASYENNGYMQDFRIYKGVAKYTSNFIPASTDPDILPDTLSGVSYSSNVALVPSTDGAVAFGSGRVLTTTSSADFNFGTGDFTIEYFLYRNSLGSNDAALTNYSQVSSGYFMCLHSNSTDAYLLLNGSTVTSGGTAEARKWIHYAYVRSGTTCTIYKDGISIASATSSAQAGATNVMNIGAYSDGSSFIDGFISNLHIVKGTALYTSNFTPPTGPISSVANTKLLCCKSNSSATAFDVSPGTITANGNAVASNFNPFTVNINTQRGQESGYCTWNPLEPTVGTLSNGNLTMVGSSAWKSTKGTVSVSSGKWYYEGMVRGNTYGTATGNLAGGIGWYTTKNLSSNVDASTSSLYTNLLGFHNTGQYNNFSTIQSSTGSMTAGDIIGVALNKDNNTFVFYKNGVSVVSGSLANTTDDLTPWTNAYYSSDSTWECNFGQKPFKFPPPTGFQPLALANTPRPTIVRPDQYVGIVTYTGTGATRSLTTGFKPDFLWIKERGASGGPVIVDSVRGASATLQTHATTQEQADSDAVTGFNPYGFSLGSGYTVVSVNGSTRTYVGWAWKAGGSGGGYSFWKDDIGYSTASAAGLTAGTITPSGASVNTKSGFSIITYTGGGSGSNSTISHGLGKVPQFMIVKKKSASDNWAVYHQAIGNDYDLYLNGTGARRDYPSWGDTTPTSTVFTVGTTDLTNDSSNSFVAYIWAEIPGFSKFGTYTGNGSTDGPMVVTGFKPKWLLIKSSSAAGESWILEDTVRDTYNPASKWVYTNYSDAESNGLNIDFLSNGFKPRISGTSVNTSSATYIYAAFAESPSFNLYGGQANAR